MKRLQTKAIWMVAVLAGALMLTGCGGGGNSTNTKPQPPVAGSLDKSFGSGGIVSLGGSKGDYATDVVVQDDGTLLLTGYMTRATTGEDGVLAKLNEDGDTINNFGTNGVVISSLLKNDESNAMTTDSQGNIYLVGYLTNNSNKKQLVIAKYKKDGTLDTSFASNGAFVGWPNGLNYTGKAIAIDKNRKIVVAGTVVKNSNDTDIFVIRLNPNGSFDSNFGFVGYAEFGGNNEDTVEDIAIDKNNNILLAATTHKNNKRDIVVGRINPDGSIDGTFGNSGSVVLDRSNDDEVHAVAIDGNRNILVTGVSAGAMVLARFNSNGDLDTGFGDQGIVLDPDKIGKKSIGSDLTFDDNDNIIVTGLWMKSMVEYHMAVWRFDAIGKPDTTFGTNGLVAYDPITSFGLAVTIDNDNKIVVAGSSHQGAVNKLDMTIWRINP